METETGVISGDVFQNILIHPVVISVLGFGVHEKEKERKIKKGGNRTEILTDSLVHCLSSASYVTTIFT